MGQIASEKVYLEIGEKRVFAVALEWPGWCRSGRDEEAALQTLCDYGLRYAHVMDQAHIEFEAPSDTSPFVVIERVKGTATTDFGAPDVAPSHETAAIEVSEVERWQAILQACWQTFDKAVQDATGKTLSKGPRGGGRNLGKIVEHVRDVDISYLKSLGGKVTLTSENEPSQALPQIRRAILTTLNAAARGELPTKGPRGGIRWTARYFVRRLAWHELDHAWEIEDRAGLGS